MSVLLWALAAVGGVGAWCSIGALAWARWSGTYDPPWPVWVLFWPIGVLVNAGSPNTDRPPGPVTRVMHDLRRSLRDRSP